MGNQAGLLRPIECCQNEITRQSEFDAEMTEESLREIMQAGNGLLRAACFVCMLPRARAQPGVLDRRLHAVKEGLTTTHRPHVFQNTLDYDHWSRIQAEGGAPANMKTPQEQLLTLENMTLEELHLVGV